MHCDRGQNTRPKGAAICKCVCTLTLGVVKALSAYPRKYANSIRLASLGDPRAASRFQVCNDVTVSVVQERYSVGMTFRMPPFHLFDQAARSRFSRRGDAYPIRASMNSNCSGCSGDRG